MGKLKKEICNLKHDMKSVHIPPTQPTLSQLPMLKFYLSKFYTCLYLILGRILHGVLTILL